MIVSISAARHCTGWDLVKQFIRYPMNYIGNTIKLYNGGFVTLVDKMGSDLTVVNAARVSFNKQSQYDENGCLTSKDEKLIRYLAKHKHWTPFAHVMLTMHIKAPLSIRTQFFKHKVGFVENEVSRRYVSDDPEFMVPSFRYAPEGSMKQGSGDYLDTDTHNRAYLVYEHTMEVVSNAYKSLLRLGVAPEQARFVLPQSTMTEWYWTGSLAAYARFVHQRSDKHAQREIQDYAWAVSSVIPPTMQCSWDALMSCAKNTDTQACS